MFYYIVINLIKTYRIFAVCKDMLLVDQNLGFLLSSLSQEIVKLFREIEMIIYMR